MILSVTLKGLLQAIGRVPCGSASTSCMVSVPPRGSQLVLHGIRLAKFGECGTSAVFQTGVRERRSMCS